MIHEKQTFTQNDLDLIRQKALELGFSDARFICANDPDEAWQKKYREYLKKGFHASMKYLENISSKFSIKKIYQPVQTIAVFSLPYLYRDTETPLDEQNQKSKYTVSRYALGRDYHLVAKEKLDVINSLFGAGQGRVVCDTTPMPERYFAARAGSGFIGKNSMLIDSQTGSYFFLAFILFEKFLPESEIKTSKNSSVILTENGAYDFVYNFKANIDKFCGSCDRCVKACPGGALDGSGFLNSQKCYSFWSIENKLDMIQADFKKMTSVFGCDICQDVCPYNAQPLTTGLADFKASEISRNIMQGNFENLSLKGTAYERTGVGGLKRNMDFIDKIS
jgi:epoxyqueuosine reductase